METFLLAALAGCVLAIANQIINLTQWEIIGIIFLITIFLIIVDDLIKNNKNDS